MGMDVAGDSAQFPAEAYVRVESYSFNRDTPIEQQLDSLEAAYQELDAQDLITDSLDMHFVDTAYELKKRLGKSWERKIYQDGKLATSAVKKSEVETFLLGSLSEIMTPDSLVTIQARGCEPIYRDALIFYNDKNEIVGSLNISFECHALKTGSGQLLPISYPKWQELSYFFKRFLDHPIILQLQSYIRPMGLKTAWDSIQIPHSPYFKVVSYSLNRNTPFQQKADSLYRIFSQKKNEGFWDSLPAEKEEAELQIFLLHQKARYDFEDYIYQDGHWAYSAEKVKELTTIEVANLQELFPQPLFKSFYTKGCEPIYRDALVFYNEKNEIVGTLEICFSCEEVKSGDRQLRLMRAIDSDLWEDIRRFFKEELGHPVEE